ncbi:deaminated glutathione amidase [Aureimonas populi]|uniref:Deaminated glutathione amidase n=1 Tax=Aureimonas populi TaxID=1701758 RepID=A0ABW5CMZ1_9HYPH|nr:deaminated glutathione amidase [Aureimonas populi]
MKVALGQFHVSPDWKANLATAESLIRQAVAGGAELLVLPEGIIARDVDDPLSLLKGAQPLDGPFVSGLVGALKGTGLTLMTTVHVPAEGGRCENVHIALSGNGIFARYVKLHLYDAFAELESNTVVPGTQVPPLVEVGGFRFGMMTCYDVRFPELARRLALDGADVLVIPAAWVKGPNKERHWETLVTARALENTVYAIAVGECGPLNIGSSLVVDPLGVPLARAGEIPALVFAELDRKRIEAARKTVPVLRNRRFAAPELAQA